MVDQPDPIVLHDNTDPTGEFPQNVAIHAGFNDTHELKVAGPNLVGQPTEIIGPAKNVPLVLPLHFDELGRLTIDLGDLTDGLAAAQANITTMQGQLAADALTISALQAAALIDEGNINTLQGQVTTLQQQVVLLLQTAVTIPVMSARFAGVGTLTATLRSISHFDNLVFSGTGNLTVNEMLVRPITASFAGAGGLTAFFSGPRQIGNLLFVGSGALTADLRLFKILVANFQGAGGINARAGLLMPNTAALVGTGSLTASLFPALFLPSTVLTASGSLTASLAKLLPTTTFAGQGNLTVTPQLQLGMVSESFDGAGVMDNSDAQLLVSARSVLTGLGGLSIDTDQWFAANASLAGAGGMLADLIQKSPFLTMLMAGQGGFIGTLNIGLGINGSLAGRGSMAVNLSNGLAVLSGMAGAGSIASVTLQQLLTTQAPLVGIGGLTVANLQKLLGTALFTGAGGYNANFAQRMTVSRIMAGAGALVANVTQSTSFSALDPVNSDTGISLSNSNRTAAFTGSTSYAIARGTKVLSTGKKYFEITLTSLGAGTYIVGGGIVRANWLPGPGSFNAVGSSSGGDNYGLAATGGAWNYASNDVNGNTGFVNAGFSVAQNDTVMVAMDIATGKIYMGVNNSWVLGLTPTGGTGLFVAATGSFYPAVTISNYTTTDRVTINVGNAAFKYTLPSGYTAWG